MEALACGTPVITFNTGGSPEMLDKSCGVVVEKDDLNGLLEAIHKVTEDQSFSVEKCLEMAKRFDQNVCFSRYLDLYRRIGKA